MASKAFGVSNINVTGSIGVRTDNPSSAITIAGPGASPQIELKRTNANVTGAIGALNFTALDGHSVANIIAVGDGDNEGANIVFRTTSAAGENSPYGANTLERLRIRSDGHILIGQTATATPGFSGNTTVGASFEQIGTNGVDGRALFLSRSSNAALFINSNANTALARFSRSGSQKGDITITTTAVSYNETSDYRLKENIVNLDGAITRVKQLQPRRFNFIAEPSIVVDGFIAHEAQTVVPESVTGTHNEVEVWKESDELPDGVSVGDNKLDDEGNTIPVYQGIDKSKLVPLLTAALQEAITKIESLQARIAALEGS